ncbi:MAG TPA: serine/threonine-protein kinase [Burkholderiaceae bacterium]|nr:serine/threonine-protein kinase [Burkholderiaceae bacterium]
MTPSRDSFWQRAWRIARSRLFGSEAPPWDMSASTGGEKDGPGTLPTSGQMFAGYRIERQLARGAMGALYLALDPRTGTPVAIKTLSLTREFEGSDLDEARQRFLREAQAAARLRHPDIVAVLGSGEEDGLAFLVMELLSGCDLSRYARPARLLPEPIVLRIGARVAAALAYAHRVGVIHRDIKPANVMLDLSNEQVKVTDFGIARLADGGRTRSGLVLGTPSFMSPEQLAGVRVDGRSDLYSLGVMLFQLLTGQLPYRAASLGDLLQQIAGSPPIDLHELRPDLPAELGEVLALALQKRPELRYADGEQLASDLRRLEGAWRGRAVVDTLADSVVTTPLQLDSTPADPRHNELRH